MSGRSAFLANVLPSLALFLLALFVAWPAQAETPQSFVYGHASAGDLHLDVWGAVGAAASRPAIVFFHGGGWRQGGPGQFALVCGLLVKYRVVCAAPEYSLDSPGTVVDESDAAVAWVRGHAASLGVNPARIAAGGTSAGGYLATATALLPSRFKAQSAPNALILLNAALNPTRGGPPTDLTQSIHRPLPPTLILHGSADQAAPFAAVQSFAVAARAAGTPDVRLIVYPNRGHAFWSFRGGTNPDYATAVGHVVDFLAALGWIGCSSASGQPVKSGFSTTYDQLTCASP